MILYKIFFRIYRYLTFKEILNFNKPAPDVSKWYVFINSIPEPYDDIEQSYARYLCRMYYFPFYYKILADFSAIFAFIISIPVYFRKTKAFYNSDEQNTNHTKSKILVVKSTNVEYIDILPESLLEEHSELIEASKPGSKKWYLNSRAKALFNEAFKRRPFKIHLNYLIFRELCIYSYLLDYYQPKTIAIYVNERNVAGPLLTNMCESKKVNLVSFMHGDYILQLIHGFMKFSRFYVWDKHYVEMFTNDLRCSPGQFLIYTPKKLLGICEAQKSAESYKYYATYYFGAESKKRIEKVAEAFSILKDKGLNLKIRPHPRRSDIKTINKEFIDFYIEDPQKISLAKSMNDSRYIIAMNSTVLSEAYYSKRDIVIDNYSDYETFLSLKDRKFIMISKPHKLFSDLLNEFI